MGRSKRGKRGHGKNNRRFDSLAGATRRGRKTTSRLPGELESLLTSAHADARLDGVVGLGKCGPEVVETLGFFKIINDRINDSDARVRLHAVGSLGLFCNTAHVAQLYGEGGVPIALVGLLKRETDPECRKHCINLLCMIAENWDGADAIVESLLESNQHGIFFQEEDALRLLLICTDSNYELCKRLSKLAPLVQEFLKCNQLMMFGVLCNLHVPNSHIKLIEYAPQDDEKPLYFQILTNSVCCNEEEDIELVRSRADAYLSLPEFLPRLISMFDQQDTAVLACGVLDNIIQNASSDSIPIFEPVFRLIVTASAQLTEEQNEPLEAVTDAATALLWSLFRRNRSWNIDIDALLSVLENHFLSQVTRCNLVGVVGILATVTQTARLATVLACCTDNQSIMVTAQAVDSIIDVFSDDALDGMFRQLKLMKVLTGVLPRLQQSVDDKFLLADREQLENVCDFLQQFIDYKR